MQTIAHLDFERGLNGVAGIAARQRILVAIGVLPIARPHDVF
jgi:hypothetical protein